MIKQIAQFIPQQALSYCEQLWLDTPFIFKIKNKRATKLGDYRYNPADKSHTITINNDLNPYAFLITYLHEVAHLRTFLTYGRKVSPHGAEWKHSFKLLTLPILHDGVFPHDVLQTLARYIKNPKASSCNDHQLQQILNSYDEAPTGIYLTEIPLGQIFKLGKRAFKKESLRRTRFLCQEVTSGRKYLISKSAMVELI